MTNTNFCKYRKIFTFDPEVLNRFNNDDNLYGEHYFDIFFKWVNYDNNYHNLDILKKYLNLVSDERLYKKGVYNNVNISINNANKFIEKMTELRNCTNEDTLYEIYKEYLGKLCSTIHWLYHYYCDKTMYCDKRMMYKKKRKKKIFFIKYI